MLHTTTADNMNCDSIFIFGINFDFCTALLLWLCLVFLGNLIQ